MPIAESEWFDLKSLVAIGGVVTGIVGLSFGVLRDRWSRRESRLDALAKVLNPLVGAAQELMLANNKRRTAEQLKNSYPLPRKSVLEGVDVKRSFPEATPEVIERVNRLVSQYNEHMNLSEKRFREAESEFATRHFRFPDRFSKQISDLNKQLSELGQLVADGYFDNADVHLASFREHYKSITNAARGWRLADPFEWLRKKFCKPGRENEREETDFELTESEMTSVMELVNRRATSQAENAFAVHPPKKLLDNPGIIESESVVDELKDSIFVVVFQDGVTKMLSLPQLMAFIYQLIVLSYEHRRLEKMFSAAESSVPAKISLKFQFSMQEIMTPEIVKVLLGKIEFSETPGDK
ncbi:MAG: hypothetical protein U0894_13145 [Pirellulales bacterium]